MKVAFEFFEWAKELLWTALPLQRNSTPLSKEQVSRVIVSCAATAVAKQVGLDLCRRALVALSDGRVDCEKPKLALSLWFLGMAVCSTAANDVQVAATALVTRGRYALMPFNDWPGLSTSLKEFWGKRYNKVMCAFFRLTVFEPMIQHGHSPAQASMAAFAASGAIHVYAPPPLGAGTTRGAAVPLS